MSEKNVVEKVMQVYRKYHLTPRQNIQVTGIVMDICNGKSVLYFAPRKAGQNTVYRAANEILKIIGKEYERKLSIKHIPKS